MEIREFAERLLFTTALEEKLHMPQQISDHTPGSAIVTPRYPGRPEALRLDHHTRAKIPFPSVNDLDKAQARGHVLHFFANHELLALELMALVLLRFPEAPISFRRGVLRTISEEQQHMRLYMERMASCGVEFGEIPVNDFFWNCISDMRDPMDYVTRLSLTFEQANLDYALHYQQAFEQIGDARTSDILKVIYADEVGHVALGLSWFNRWRDPRETEWDAYVHSLTLPLTPNRAKGLSFDVESRKKAGFSDAFIEQLELYSHSKGRPPRVFWFQPDCESHIGHDSGPYSAPKGVAALQRDMAILPMFLAAQDDVLLLPERPTHAHLLTLKRAGLEIPELLVYSNAALAQENPLAGRKLGRLCPWGWNPGAVRFLKPLFSQTVSTQTEGQVWHPALRQLYAKSLSADWLRDFLEQYPDRDWLCPSSVVGESCADRAAVEGAVAHFRQHHDGDLLLKANFGSAGKNHFRLPAGGALPASRLRWIERICSAHGAIVVEPLLDRHFDCSFHGQLTDEGELSEKGICRFLADAHGHYHGAIVGRFVEGLGDELIRFLYRPGTQQPRLNEICQAVLQFVANRALALDYHGPFGVDAFAYRDQAGSLRFKPIVEVNPRWTMGRVALALARRIKHGRSGLWLQLSIKELTRAGFPSAAAFAEALAKALPLQLDQRAGSMIEGGTLFTSDPAQATQFVTVLLVCKRLGELLDTLDRLSPDAPLSDTLRHSLRCC